MYISWFQIKLLTDECPMKWFKKYKEKPRVAVDNRRFMVGWIVDRLLVDWMNGISWGGFQPRDRQKYSRQPQNFDPLSPQWMPQQAADYMRDYLEWNHVNFLGATDFPKMCNKAEMAADKLERLWFARGLNLHNFRTEEIVKLHHAGHILDARPDLPDYDAKYLLDLKTTEKKQWLDIGQLAWYAGVIMQKTGIPFKRIGWLVPLMPEGLIEFDLTQQMLTDVKMKFMRAVEIVQNGVFHSAYKKSSCGICEFKPVCEFVDQKALNPENANLDSLEMSVDGIPLMEI